MKSKLDDINDWERLAEAANYSPFGMASACRVSLRQLERYFLAKKGQRPQKWLNELRLQRKAPHILIQDQHSVKEVSAILRYDRAYFSREFKRIHGVSPAIYQRGVERA